MFFKRKKKYAKKSSPESSGDGLPPLGWSGNFASWEEVKVITGGYDEQSIVQKVREALLKVKRGEAAYERDSVLFDEKQYSWGVLAALLRSAVEKENRLSLVDFGGSLGSSYYQNRDFLGGLTDVKWGVVEQANFVDEGRKYFEDEELKFFRTIGECVEATGADVLLASSVLQYLPEPYECLAEIKAGGFRYVIIDRTAFIEGECDRLTLQRVPPDIYDASYPSWFFNYDKFVRFLSDEYELVAKFDNGFTAPVMLDGRKCEWFGILFKRK